MDTVELLRKFSDPEVVRTLTMMERMVAGLITTALGMGITFVSLVVLQFVIGLMARLGEQNPEQEQLIQQQVATEALPLKEDDLLRDEEIVAAISTALAMKLKTSVGNIVIRNIEKVEESTSAWHKAGIAEQMNNSL